MNGTVQITGPSFNSLLLRTTAPNLADTLFGWLRSADPTQPDADIAWNFTKFLLDTQGRVIRRYSPSTEPADLRGDVEAQLLGTRSPSPCRPGFSTA